MSIVEQRIEWLKEANEKLGQLLADPHPGLGTWLQAVVNATNDIDNIMKGRKDKERVK